jgi:plastocyanin
MKRLAIVCALAATAGLAEAQTIPCDLAAAQTICPGASQVVCIDNFVFDPPVVVATPGDTIAWVNVESACTQEPAKVVGCNAHHVVATIPDLDGQAVTSGPICSPSGGQPGGLAGVTADEAAGCLPGATNVFCHTFAAPTVQHYYCTTNPFHEAVMHGSVVVQ